MATPLHVVVLPWSAFGHMIPYLNLALALAKAGVRVTYVSTPRNIQRLPQIPRSLTALVEYKELPMPKVKELAEGAESTLDLTFDQIEYLKVAYDLLEEPFTQIIVDQSPDWIITDFASYWAPKIADKYGASHIYFSAFSAATRCFFALNNAKSNPENLATKPSSITFPSSVAYRKYEVTGLHVGFYGNNASRISDAERVRKIHEGCRAVAIRSCREFEGEYIDLYKSLSQKPFIPVGLLPPEQLNESENELGVFKWLDEQACRSVVFVGFGSESKLTKEEVYEIAYGLEMSKLPFLWALQRPVWADEETEALPMGFRDRVVGKGFVCLGWAPQQKILAHPSVGGCLLHSGWGSVIESLQYGHCLVVLPFITDQGLNARLLGDKGLAIEVDRREDGSFNRDDIARALMKAMVEEEGKKIRASAMNVAQVFGDRKLHESYIDELVEYMKVAGRK
uniref:UFGT7 n=1 Tax=Fagopyrum tataricum TaxID=62330 RepID=A0A385L2G1_FAGTA|nr:UFGT7 [Fagopyrum tataricum]